MDEKEKHNISVDKKVGHGAWKAILFAALSICETILFAGIQYGWGTLLYVFKDEGIYADLCSKESINVSHKSDVISHQALKVTNATTLPCPEQDQQFNLWFSIATGIGMASSVVIGQMSTSFGEPKTRMICIPLFVVGALCIGFASKDLPWMILPGLTLLSVGGYSILITNIRVALFLKVGSAVYLGLHNGAYDSSSIMTRVVKALYENGIGRKYSFIGLSVLHVIISGFATLVHSRFTVPVEDTQAEVESIQTDVAQDENIEMDKTKTEGRRSESNIAMKQRKELPDKKPSLKHHLTSALYVFHLIYFSILVLKFVFFLGSINKQLELAFDDKSEVEYFTDVMAYTLMGGIIGSFISGSLLEWQKKYFSDSTSEQYRKLMPQVAPLSVCGILGISLSALSFITSSHDVFYGLFINLVLLRSFIYAVNMGFITMVFPAEFTGVLFGFAITLSGMIGLLQYALFIWMEAYEGALNQVSSLTLSGVIGLLQYALFIWMEAYEGAFYHVNWVLLGLGVLTLCHPVNVYIQARKTNKSKMEHKQYSML